MNELADLAAWIIVFSPAIVFIQTVRVKWK